jgi:arylsulfatase A-like enzyme
VPVTYAYISDAHDNHAGGGAYGPGQAGYVAALKAYDDAFGKFFSRLDADGISRRNTLFVFTSDEGDHYSGGAGTPAGCDGINTPCVYSHVSCPATSPPSCPANNVGETNANFAGLLATQQSITTPFKVHSDSAPTVYITGNPLRTDSVTRNFERAAGQLVGRNPQTGNSEQIMTAMADPIEMKLLHMITADPARTPTFTYFARPEYFLFAGAPNCNSPCLTQSPGFAWQHGDFQPEIVTTWLGMVGPGVRNLGATNAIWSDHTDIRPTMLALTGLRDDYASDGRVLVEALKGDGLSESLAENRDLFVKLAQVYKQINAPVGQLGLSTLVRSTQALRGDNATYATIENQLIALNARRDTIAGEMIAMLNAATFDGTSINEERARDLIQQGENLLGQGDDQQGD